jgi:rubredoxin
MSRYLCDVCGYVYDEATGAPEDGAPVGTQWTDLPEDWVCPDCGAPRHCFIPLEPEVPPQ